MRELAWRFITMFKSYKPLERKICILRTTPLLTLLTFNV